MWLRFLLLLLFTTNIHAITTICVYYNESIDDNQDTSCDRKYSNLTQALEDCRSPGNIAFLLQSGGVHELATNGLCQEVTNIIISSMSGDETPPVVDCQYQSGLTFINSSEITIANVTFNGCSVEHTLIRKFRNSTLNVSMYFMNCKNIHINYVTVMNSTGSAIVSRSLNLGHNFINNSNFINNIPYPGKMGGGVGIELTVCPKQAANCLYYGWTIENSNFTNNMADFDKNDITEMNDPTSDLHHGRGGGLYILIINGVGGTFTINKCHFKGNRALYGGGLFISIESDIVASNIIQIKNTTFIDNNALYGGGGGASIFLNSNGNSIKFENTHFNGNIAKMGGGFSLHTTKTQNVTNQLSAYNCFWSDNAAYTGKAVAMVAWLTYSMGYPLQPLFKDCIFLNNFHSILAEVDINTAFTGQIPDSIIDIGTLYTDSVSVAFKGHSIFKNNNPTAIYAVNAELNFTTNSTALFYRNSGGNGGGIALIGSAAIIVGKNSSFNFTENSATVHGGAIYAFITSQHHDLVSINCFVRYFQQSKKPSEWNTSFYFYNNNAMGKNETIFATTLDYCSWQEKNKTRQFFCNDESKWKFEPDSSCQKEVSTLPANIKILNSLRVIPGMLTNINLNATDDTGKTVSSFELTVTNSSGNNNYDTVETQYISDNRISVLSKSKSNHFAVFIAQSAFPRSLDVKIQVEVEECPPGYFLDTVSKKCKCTPGQFNNLVRCLSNFTALIKKGYWIGKTSYSEKPVIGPCRFCEPSDEYIRGGYVILPRSYAKINKVLCGENKNGTLCTSCNKEESYALTITGYGCYDCSKSSAEYAWALFIVTQLLPVSVMFFILYFTNFSLASGYLNGAIFFAQTITTSLDISGNGEVPLRNATDASDVLVQVYDILYFVWNLDFIEPIKYCLAPHLSMNSIFVIQYAVALFPLVFVILIFIYHRCSDSIELSCLCRLNPLKRCYEMITDCWKKFKTYADIKSEISIRNTLASCILLAYTRCALNTCYILYPAGLFDASHHIITTVSYFDASTKYGQSTEHLVCVIIAVLVLMLFLLPVPVFLFFCRYRNLNRISYFNIILESLQCEFKDGSIIDNSENQETLDNATHDKATVFQRPSVSCVKNTFFIDLRWVSSLYFTMRIAMTLAYITTSTFIAQVLIQQVLLCIMVTIILVLQPYKERVHNQIDGCIFLLIIIINSITLYQYTLSISMENLSLFAFIVQYILVYLPMIWIAVYIIWRVVKLFKLVMKNKSTYHRMDMMTASSPRDESTEIPK